jgi:hypothetical protein
LGKSEHSTIGNIDAAIILLSAKELAFVRSMAKWRGQPTKRQKAWLSSLYERCMKGEHPPC